MLRLSHRFPVAPGFVMLVLIATLLPTTPANTLAIVNIQYASLVLGQPDFNSRNAPLPQTGMNGPNGIALDPTSGKVFVADTAFGRVLRFPSLAALRNGTPPEGVLGALDLSSAEHGCGPAEMNHPHALTVDSSGRLWVGDTENHRVLRFDNASLKPNGASADGVLGQPDLGTCNAGTAQNTMTSPHGVTIDSSGRLWVADTSNNRVLRFDNAATKPNGANADGVLGQPDFASQIATTSQNGMSTPSNATIDSAGHLWVADTTNNRVLRFDAAAAKPNGANADGVLGQADFSNAEPSAAQNGMQAPRGVTTDADGRLWVADSANDRILGFNNAAQQPNGAPATTMFGRLRLAAYATMSSANELRAPNAVVYDPASDTLWVADTGDNRVLLYRTLIPASLVLGQPDFTSYGTQTSASGMAFPTGVAGDRGSGKIFVADSLNNRILRFASLAALHDGAAAEAVLGQPDFSKSSAGCSAGALSNPAGIVVDTSGRLWVADQGNARVLRFDAAANRLSGTLADAVLGQSNFTTCYPTRTQRGLDSPDGITIDSTGRLWVADSANNRVLRFDSAATKLNGANADGVLGQPDFISAIPRTSQNGIRNPRAVVADSAGRLWIADWENHRILRFNNAATKPNGANADGVLGQPDFISAIPRTSQHGMWSPHGITINANGQLWVADEYNNRILRFDNAATKANGAPADGVLGQPDFASSDGATSAVGLTGPNQLAYDPITAVLWIADTINNRVLVYGTLPSSTPTPTNAPTNTPAPSNTIIPPTATSAPTNTPAPPTATNTPAPSNTIVPPTTTRTPTNTPILPTITSTPTNTPAPPSPIGSLVISQVYGGGGNTGATYRNDFVELFNRGTTTVSLDTWSLQYAASTGIGSFSAHVTPLHGSLAPGQYYLIQLASDGAAGSSLPMPDAIGITSMGATNGKVILADTSTGLRCNGSSTPCTSAQLAHIIDLVGYGDANFYEGGAAALSPSAKKAALRLDDGCIDTNNNRTDFWIGSVLPRNTLAPRHRCTTAASTSSLTTKEKSSDLTDGHHPSTALLTILKALQSQR